MGGGVLGMIETSSLVFNSGISTLSAGVAYLEVTFDQSYPVASPTVVLTSATDELGGAVNAYVTDLTTTTFRINVSDTGNTVKVHWHAIR